MDTEEFLGGAAEACSERWGVGVVNQSFLAPLELHKK
jgi:hypothetical protein